MNTAASGLARELYLQGRLWGRVLKPLCILRGFGQIPKIPPSIRRELGNSRIPFGSHVLQMATGKAAPSPPEA